MTKLSFKEIRDKLSPQVTIWGGIPSISVLKDSMDDYEFDKFINMTLESVGRGDHLILSIADTTPPDAEFERILKIMKKAKEFGNVNP